MHRQIDIEQLCADKGLRITEQRRIIAKVLGDSEDHPDVETLHCAPPRSTPIFRSPRSIAPSGCSKRRDPRTA